MTPNCRASEVFDFPLGTVLSSSDPTEGSPDRYIFIGWKRNTAGHEAHFIRPVSDVYVTCRGAWSPRGYQCAMAMTLLKKFPDAVRYTRSGDQS